MVDWIESWIGAIDGMEKRQQMCATKDRGQRPFQEMLEVLKSAPSETIDLSDELNLIHHSFSL